MKSKLFSKERKNYVICNSLNFKSVYKTPEFPIFQGVVNKVSDFKKHSQYWIECENCGSIQLKFLLPLSLIYEHYYKLTKKLKS